MLMKEKYDIFIEKQNAMLNSRSAYAFTHQEKRYMEPFQIFGNLYYVGDEWVCIHLIDTG